MLGDFNARVRRDNQTWIGVIGTKCVVKKKSNGIVVIFVVLHPSIQSCSCRDAAIILWRSFKPDVP